MTWPKLSSPPLEKPAIELEGQACELAVDAAGHPAHGVAPAQAAMGIGGGEAGLADARHAGDDHRPLPVEGVSHARHGASTSDEGQNGRKGDLGHGEPPDRV